MDNTGYRAAMARLLDTLDLIWVQGTSAQRAEALGGLLLAASNLPESIGDAGARRPAVTPTVRQAILGDEQAAARQDALQRQQEAGLTDEDRRAIQAEARKLARRLTMLMNDPQAARTAGQTGSTRSSASRPTSAPGSTAARSEPQCGRPSPWQAPRAWTTA